jgi:hypothetical protein
MRAGTDHYVLFHSQTNQRQKEQAKWQPAKEMPALRILGARKGNGATDMRTNAWVVLGPVGHPGAAFSTEGDTSA